MSFWLDHFGVSSPLTIPRMAPTFPLSTGPSMDEPGTLSNGSSYSMVGGDRAPVKYPWPMPYKCEFHGTSAADLRAQLFALDGWRGAWDRLFRIADDDGSLQWCWARMMRVIRSRQAIHDLFLPVEIEWAIWSPWHSVSGNTLQLTYTASGQVQPYTHLGNANNPEATLTLTVYNGNIGQVNIFNGGTYKAAIYYNGGMTANQTLVIDCLNKSVKKSGVEDFNGFKFAASHTIPEWFRLFPGTNNVQLTWTVTSGTPTFALNMAWDDMWE